MNKLIGSIIGVTAIVVMVGCGTYTYVPAQPVVYAAPPAVVVEPELVLVPVYPLVEYDVIFIGGVRHYRHRSEYRHREDRRTRDRQDNRKHQDNH